MSSMDALLNQSAVAVKNATAAAMDEDEEESASGNLTPRLSLQRVPRVHRATQCRHCIVCRVVWLLCAAVPALGLQSGEQGRVAVVAVLCLWEDTTREFVPTSSHLLQASSRLRAKMPPTASPPLWRPPPPPSPEAR